MGLLVFGFYPDNMDSVQQLGLGLFWSFAVAAALFWRARTPLRRTALFQHLIAAATIALLVVITLGDVGDSAPPVRVVAFVVLGALHPARQALLRVGERPSVVAAALLVAAVVPLMLYGLGQTRSSARARPAASTPASGRT